MALCLLHPPWSFDNACACAECDHYLLAARTLIGEQVLDTARTEVGDAARVETQLIEGPPAPAILRVAQEEAFDLIVLGSRGQGQLAGLLLGSVSSAVAQRADCPVLIVH
jgi:nucleotide-binding universal stress UspA family protein